MDFSRLGECTGVVPGEMALILVELEAYQVGRSDGT